MEQKIPLKEKIMYASGEFYGAGYAALIGALLLGFMTKSLGINPAVASAIIMVSKIWDSISDPLMGVISDNTRSKYGRRRPWIVIGGALVPFAFMLMFAPVQNLATAVKIVFATVGYILLCTVNTISQVPYCSLSNEISADFKERNSANSIKLLFSMAGAAICYLVPNIIFNSHLDYLETGSGGINGAAFFAIAGVAFGLAFAIPVVLCGIYSKERIPYDKEHKAKFSLKNYLEPLKIKSYRYQLIMYIAAFLCMDLISAVLVYYARDVMQGVILPLGKWEFKLQSAFLIAPLMIMVAVMYPFVMKAMNKKSKQFAFRMGLPCYVLGAVGLCVFPAIRESNALNWLIIVFSMLMGIGFGGAQMMPWLMFPDSVDVAELKTGVKDTGSYSGLMTFMRKFATAFAIFFVGIGMTAAGYDEVLPIQKADNNTLFTVIRVMIAVPIVVFISLALFVSFKYKLDDKNLSRVRYFLEIQRAGKVDEMSEEEKTEMAALIKDLA